MARNTEVIIQLTAEAGEQMHGSTVKALRHTIHGGVVVAFLDGKKREIPLDKVLFIESESSPPRSRVVNIDGL